MRGIQEGEVWTSASQDPAVLALVDSLATGVSQHPHTREHGHLLAVIRSLAHLFKKRQATACTPVSPWYRCILWLWALLATED